jgi:choline-sulfatase
LVDYRRGDPCHPLFYKPNMVGRPNVVLILTDEERSGGSFESKGAATWRANALPHHSRLSREGVTFSQHRCSSTACAPSRASIFTGLSLWTHGISQTDGFAKIEGDAGLVSLDPKNGPRTLGHRFEEMGYEVVYVGEYLIISRPELQAGARSWTTKTYRTCLSVVENVNNIVSL